MEQVDLSHREETTGQPVHKQTLHQDKHKQALMCNEYCLVTFVYAIDISFVILHRQGCQVLKAVAAPGGFLGFLETGQPSHQARHVASNAVRGRHDHSYEQGDWLGHSILRAHTSMTTFTVLSI